MPARRVLLPVYAAGIATLVALVGSNLLYQVSPGANVLWGLVFLALFATVPIAFLLGILRSRLAPRSVAGMMISLEHGLPLREAIAEALGDPSLGLAFWLERDGRWVDGEGRQLDLTHVPQRAVTVVEREGRRVGALLHDESLSDQPELVESVSAAAAFAIDNERLRAELRAQNEFLSTIVDTAPSLLLTVDTDARIRTLNPATLSATGLDDESQVRGKFFWEVFLDPDERPAMQERFRAAAPEHAAAEYENTFTNARGERVSIIWRGAPVRGESGEVEGIVAAGLDVTERRRAGGGDPRVARAGSSPPATRSGAGSSGTCTTAPSSDSSRSRWPFGSRSRSSAPTPMRRRGSSRARARSSPTALEELRELARGIHPAVLTDRGLDAALEGLAARSPLPVELARVGRRLPEPIEAAAYYVVSEAVANIVKHGQRLVDPASGIERRERRGSSSRSPTTASAGPTSRRLGAARPRRPGRGARRTAAASKPARARAHVSSAPSFPCPPRPPQE